jgi:acyl-CoA hydrolase
VYDSIHAHPEFRRWLQEDLLKIATLMAGNNITPEQRAAADELAKAVADAAV